MTFAHIVAESLGTWPDVGPSGDPRDKDANIILDDIVVRHFCGDDDRVLERTASDLSSLWRAHRWAFIAVACGSQRLETEAYVIK